MWSTLSAGFQIVQDKLDHVLEDASGQDQTESTDGATGASTATPGDSHETATDESMSPEMGGATGLPPPAQLEQEGLIGTPPPSPGHVPSPTEGNRELESLRLALQAAEEQTQLINNEYGKLLREKELEIDKLRTEVARVGATQLTGTDGGGQAQEVLQKELVAHKEMVSELRKQLDKREGDYKELNAKAETKFNKLKAQAKAKIATLNRDLERLRGELGETQHNVSAQSLDDSITSVGVSPEASQVQLDVLRAELVQREKEVAALKQEQLLWQQEKEKEMPSLKDKLNVSEVCLQKEQENRVKLELRVTELEELIDSQSNELSAATTAQNQLQQELAQEREASLSLQAQVISSQVDSEEEWKVVQLRGSNTPVEKSPESSLPTELKQAPVSEESPAVLVAGDRASLLDLESEVSRLESVLKERDEQLSSFKSILERKEALLREQEVKERSLSLEIAAQSKMAGSLETRVTEKQSEVEVLKSQLEEGEGALAAAQNQIEVLESESTDLKSSKRSLEASTDELTQQLQQVQDDLEESKKARDSFEQELWNKVSEISNLGDEIESHKAALAEKAEELLQQSSEIKRSQQMLQELQASNEALRASIDGDEQESAQKLAKSIEQIQELKGRVAELNAVLQAKELELQRLTSSKQQLEQHLQSTCDKESAAQQGFGELQRALEQQRETSSATEGKLREELQGQGDRLNEALQQRDDVIGQLRQAETDGKQLKEKLAQVQLEREVAEKRASQLESDLARSSGALGFAQQELASRDTTIKSLSQALEEKKAALAKLESSTASMKSESADKLTEIMQRSEQSLQNKTALENELRETKLQLQSKEELLTKSDATVRELESNKATLSQELQASRLQLNELQREKDQVKVTTETLQGQVQSLSEDKAHFTRSEVQHQQETSQLQSKIRELSSQVAELQQKLKNAKQQLTKAVKDKQEFQTNVQQLENDLARYKRENQQMKEQFDSAVKLMETNATEQGSLLSHARQEIAMKDAECISLKEQALSEGRKTAELKERLGKLTADYKVSADRCRLLEREKLELQQTISSLTTEHSQLEQSFSEVLSEKESLTFEHQASLRGVQENEGRLLELTNQIAQLAREKEGLENHVRELTRQHSSSEQKVEQLRTEVAGLKVQAREAENWQREKQALLQDREALEREKSVLQASLASQQSQLQHIQSTQEQLQQALQESHTEVESLQRASERSSANEEVQIKLQQLQSSHSQEVARLQHSLQEEGERRQATERALRELQGEVSIGMEDLQPVATPGAEGGPRNLADYVQMAGMLLQRLIKNPNIVLTRLLRATPQTKLLFLAYFILLHLFILYVLIV